MAGLKKASNNNDLEKVVNEIESEGYRTQNEDIEVSEDGYVHDVPTVETKKL